MTEDKKSYAGNLSYTNYFTQRIDDLLTLALTGTFEFYSSGSLTWDYYGSLLGQKYVNNPPETTEVGFDYVGFEFGADRIQDVSPKLIWGINPGIKVLNFTNFSNRLDLSLFGSTDVKYKIDKKWNVSGYLTLDTTSSSISDYSLVYIEIGGAGQYLPDSQWQLDLSLSLRDTSFISRTVSTVTVISRGRGQGVITGQQDESLSYSHLEASATYFINKTLMGKGTVMTTNQTSLSGTENYSEDEILGTIIAVF